MDDAARSSIASHPKSTGEQTMNRRTMSGLTLLELLVVMAISGVMATIGVPSFRDLIQNNSMTSHANQLVSSLHLARSEAVKRGINSGLMSLDDSSWSKGWTVWADTNGDGVINAGEEKLREVAEMEGNISAASIENLKVIAYKADGTAAQSTTVRLCYDNTDKGRLVEVAPNGRIATTTKSCE